VAVHHRLKHGKRKGGGLTGPGLCNAEHIMPLEQGRNSLFLHWRWDLVTFAFEGAKQRLGQTERGKIRHRRT
jgi:hypothetical protein